MNSITVDIDLISKREVMIMSYDSYRNKRLLRFPDGRLMLLAQQSESNVTDWRGRRIWDWVLFHPEGSLFFTTETLKSKQTEYVERQLSMLRDHSEWEVKNGFAQAYVEPSIESHDYFGTVWPGGNRIKNGRAFFGGRPTKAEDFFAEWGNPEKITFETWDKDMNTVAKATYNILRNDLDALYEEFQEKNGKCYIGIN